MTRVYFIKHPRFPTAMNVEEGWCILIFLLYQGLSETTQKTLKHIPLTHTSSLNPRLVFNYTLFYFIMMSNKLSTFISTSILYYLLILILHAIHLGVILDSSFFYILYPTIRKSWQCYLSKISRTIYFSLSPLQTSWSRTSIISHLLPY